MTRRLLNAGIDSMDNVQSILRASPLALMSQEFGQIIQEERSLIEEQEEKILQAYEAVPFAVNISRYWSRYSRMNPENIFIISKHLFAMQPVLQLQGTREVKISNNEKIDFYQYDGRHEIAKTTVEIDFSKGPADIEQKLKAHINVLKVLKDFYDNGIQLEVSEYVADISNEDINAFIIHLGTVQSVLKEMGVTEINITNYNSIRKIRSLGVFIYLDGYNTDLEQMKQNLQELLTSDPD